jgi:hypothetical protein
MNQYVGFAFSPISIAFTIFIYMIRNISGIHPGVHFHQSHCRVYSVSRWKVSITTGTIM